MLKAKRYDRIIIGAGLYGLYAADRCAGRGEKVLVLEYEAAPFLRATYVNQARVHMGYHYPRSLSTAMKSAGYYRRFHEDFGFAIHSKFRQIYATSAQFSWTDAAEFRKFCKAAEIFCEEISPNAYFHEGMCDGAFLTQEDTYDARMLREYYMKRLGAMSLNVRVQFEARLTGIRRREDGYEIDWTYHGAEEMAYAPFVLNATYASTNQVLRLVEGTPFEPFPIKYELCEIILCRPSEALKPLGITVMDGPFFSIMPFGLTGYHSLTSVTFTPHMTSYEETPVFSCQKNTACTPAQLDDCNTCPGRPVSAWPYMSHLAEKYLRPEYGYTYERSLYSMKPILKASEVDDSRPTAIRKDSENPTFVSVLSGKINTVYDLDGVLDNAAPA